MQIDIFIEKEKAGWQRLETLTMRSRGNAEALAEAELYELGRLYQIATSDLALAQRDFPSHQTTRYLNQLVGRAHAVLYREEPLRWQQLRNFYGKRFPRLYRQLLPYTTAAFVLFLLPAIVAFAVVWQTPDHIYTLLGQDIAPLVHTVESGKLWTEIAPSVRSSASATILTNNIGVMFYAFAGSLTGGLLTLYILLFNGLSLGAIFGLLQFHGMSPGLAEFILAHGPIELSVIFLAGGCGLFVADGLLRPGLRTRQTALTERAKIAVQLILGSVPLLIGAGLIEGFISPSGLPWPVKALVGLATGVALYRYWLKS
ncbi:MAG: stage II sporulation protein M [Caldilineaceae bacterium]